MIPIPLRPGKKLSAQEKAEIGVWVAEQYRDQHRSIRPIAADLDRSYGFVRRLLHEQGVILRKRGRSCS